MDMLDQLNNNRLPFAEHLGIRFIMATKQKVTAELLIRNELCTRVIGEATPVHRGRTTMVWQTKTISEEGKPVAVVTQTQLVLPA